jgi:hypothetical protein
VSGVVSRRAARIAAWLSIASLAGIAPHVVDDSVHGGFHRIGMSDELYGWIVAVAVLATVLGAAGTLLGRRGGLPLLLAMAVLWSGVGLFEHHRAFLPVPFRETLSSRVWVWLLVGLQAGAAVSGLAAFPAWRRAAPGRSRAVRRASQ